jgi:hypothetical protein
MESHHGDSGHEEKWRGCSLVFASNIPVSAVSWDVLRYRKKIELMETFLFIQRVRCKYCHDLGVWDYRRGMDWWMDLLPTYTHPSELQVITTVSLVFTNYKTRKHRLSLLQPAISSSAVPWQRLLTVEILHLHALRSSCRSRPCRTFVNWQLNYSVISPQSPLQNSTDWLPQFSSFYSSWARTV